MKNLDSNKLKDKKVNPMFYSISFFILSIVSKLCGFKNISMIFLYLFFISVCYGIYYTTKVVYNDNKKGLRRLKEGQSFFDGSLSKEQDSFKENRHKESID